MKKRILSGVVTLTKHYVITVGAIDIQINLKIKHTANKFAVLDREN